MSLLHTLAIARQDIKSRLVEANGLAHSGLDVQGLDVLPVFLEQGDEEVDAYIVGRVDQGDLDDEISICYSTYSA